MNTTHCTDPFCCPARRKELGLPCFKTMSRVSAPQPAPLTEAQARALSPRGAALSLRSGMGHGPARWVPVR